MKNLLGIAIEAVRLGSKILNDHFGRVSSDVDRKSEEVMRDFLERELPDSVFLGEEMGQKDAECTYRWIVDPLDGTTNYLQKFPLFAISVALEKRITGEHWGDIVLGAIVQPPTGDA